jgi:hypothetical protein
MPLTGFDSAAQTAFGEYTFQIVCPGRCKVKRPPLFTMRIIAALTGLSITFCVPLANSFALAADATSTIETIEYEDVFDGDEASAPAEPEQQSLATFGPFRVVDENTATISGVIDSASPNKFRQMLKAHPGIKRLELIECPGSEDDDANLQLARLIRAAGIDTHVPRGGSVRSGGVELFLAGVRRTADKGAEFGVHSWVDSDGYEATDYAENDPVHTAYLSYYQDMGLSAKLAREFYTFTNSAAPHDGVYYMKPNELTRFGLLN